MSSSDCSPLTEDCLKTRYVASHSVTYSAKEKEGKTHYMFQVANFWCTLSLFIKIQKHMSTVTLVRLALFATVLAVLPSQFHLFRYPTIDRYESFSLYHSSKPRILLYFLTFVIYLRFILALTNSALGFFLFSFHVHEKTILIPGLTTLLLFIETPVAAVWFQVRKANHDQTCYGS